jgi:hypothetical protein
MKTTLAIDETSARHVRSLGKRMGGKSAVEVVQHALALTKTLADLTDEKCRIIAEGENGRRQIIDLDALWRLPNAELRDLGTTEPSSTEKTS